MAYPYVKQTWTDGVSQTTAARMGVLEQGVYDAQSAACARVYHDAAQAVANATLTKLAFNTERFDVDGLGTSTIHDTAVNNTRLTARVAGKYQVTGNITFAANATGERIIYLLLNNVAVIGEQRHSTNSVVGAETTLCVTTLWNLAVNDYVEVQAYQTSGGSLNVVWNNARSNEFMMVRVA